MNRTMLALAGATLAMAGAAAQAQDLAAGKAVFDKFNCASCHGADAKSAVDPAYPTLAGQHADYLVHALKAYKRGASGSAATANVRKNPIMGAFAAQLSDQDINNVAAWFRLSPAIWACGSRGSTPKRCALPQGHAYGPAEPDPWHRALGASAFCGGAVLWLHDWSCVALRGRPCHVSIGPRSWV